MHILGKRWLDGYLDYALGEGQVRIQVACWANVGRIAEMFAEHPKSLLLVWQYIKEIGVRCAVRKIRSRMNETLRNQVYYSVGLGKIVESSDAEAWPVGTSVAFLAPSHPKCVERIVLPTPLVRRISEETLKAREDPAGVRWYPEGPKDALVDGLIGWQGESGVPLDDEGVRRVFDVQKAYWHADTDGESQLLPLKMPSPIREMAHHFQSKRQAPLIGVLFGMGNYAKTQIIPNVDPYIKIRAVHEINPTQIGPVANLPWDVSTSPSCAERARYDVHFLAGYHHTHTDQAIVALERGAVAVVEKPLVTTESQLERLLAAIQRTQGKLFACFHMRYNPLFALARRDLGVGPGEPIHCSCDVFETPLPRYHWYRWPNSGSHLISNGCHWIDHFLFMNDFALPTRYEVIKSSNGDTTVMAELENGAVFNLHLTHIGSARIGVQDHVAIRAGDRTATVTNGSRYLAENRVRVLRKKTLSRINAYSQMYRSIADAIEKGKPGDSERSIRVTSRLVLALEKEWQAR